MIDELALWRFTNLPAASSDILCSLMSFTLVISYDLHPPQGTEVHGLNASTKHRIEVTADRPGYPSYYEALRVALKEARRKTGEELTLWKDAVGKGEDTKEAAVPKKMTDEEDEDEEEEAE